MYLFNTIRTTVVRAPRLCFPSWTMNCSLIFMNFLDFTITAFAVFDSMIFYIIQCKTFIFWKALLCPSSVKPVQWSLNDYWIFWYNSLHQYSMKFCFLSNYLYIKLHSLVISFKKMHFLNILNHRFITSDYEHH